MRRGSRPASPARQLRLALTLAMPLALLVVRPRNCAAAQQPAPPSGSLPTWDAGLLGVARVPASAERRQVRISLEEHRLYVLEGERVVWSARISTGTGARLEGAGQVWSGPATSQEATGPRSSAARGRAKQAAGRA